jgi:hypothetical protein
MSSLHQIVDSHIAQLLEHCDAVQILMTGPLDDTEGVWSLARGGGNWFARQGLAHQFINQDLAQEHARQIDMILPNED